MINAILATIMSYVLIIIAILFSETEFKFEMITIFGLYSLMFLVFYWIGKDRLIISPKNKIHEMEE